MEKTTVTNRQSLLDVAVQWGGNAQSAFEIALQNNLSLTDDLHTGQKLILRPAPYDNKDIAVYYAAKGILPATAVTDNFISEIYDPGIGEMIIEKTFIIR